MGNESQRGTKKSREIRVAFDPPYFVHKTTVEDRMSDSFRYILLKRYCTNFGQKFRV